LEIEIMLISPMPSPSGTNREKLFILQGGRGGLNPRGAYDSRRRLAYDTLGASPNDPDPVKQIAEWAKENLSADDLSRLIGALGREAQQNMPAADDDPDSSIDPIKKWLAGKLQPQDMSTLQKMISKLGSAGAQAADDEPVVDPLQTRGKAPGARVGMDAAATKGLFARFPELARIGRAF
jgi:hypothetical protein